MSCCYHHYYYYYYYYYHFREVPPSPTPVVTPAPSLVVTPSPTALEGRWYWTCPLNTCSAPTCAQYDEFNFDTI